MSNQYTIMVNFPWFKGSIINEDKIINLINEIAISDISPTFNFNSLFREKRSKYDFLNGEIKYVENEKSSLIHLVIDLETNISQILKKINDIYQTSNLVFSSVNAFQAKSDLELDVTQQRIKDKGMFDINQTGISFNLINYIPPEHLDYSKYYRPRLSYGISDKVLEQIKDIVCVFKRKDDGSYIVQLTEFYDPFNFDEVYYNTYKKVYDIIKKNMKLSS